MCINHKIKFVTKKWYHISSKTDTSEIVGDTKWLTLSNTKVISEV